MYLNRTKSKHQFPLMDIQSTTPATPAPLQPIRLFPTLDIYHRRICLQNEFTTDVNSQINSHLLTLVNNVLLVSDLRQEFVQPFAALQLTFDLKFEVIYAQEKNILSSKIGIRLYENQESHFQVYSSEMGVIDNWVCFLTKKINQKGFHQMFKPLKKLGKGNFASVYEVERLTDGRKFAVKAFSKQTCFNAKNGKDSLINQLTIMRELSLEPHPNVLKLEGVFESDNSIYVVLELLTGGQLFHRIQQANGYFSQEEVRQFMQGLLDGMRHLHGHRIMHRDIKPENIMLRNQGSMVPVIVDFGLATPADIDKYLFFRCGTPGYVAPEIIELNQSKHIEPQCDIFSAGVIFHILLTRKALFEGTRYDEVYKKNKEMKVQLDGDNYRKVDTVPMDLLSKMLLADPMRRVSAAQALNHNYFQNASAQEFKPASPCLTNVSLQNRRTFNFDRPQ